METRDNLRKLDVGCGYTMTNGYLRMDANANCPSLDYVGMMNELPFPDGFLEEIRASHVIEHVPFPVAREVLAEFYRALQPGGFVWLDTPNINRNISRYLLGGWEADFMSLTSAEREYCSLDGKPNKTLWLNFKIFSSPVEFDTHFGNYDEELLIAFCQSAGFTRVETLQLEPSLIIRAFK